MDLCTRRGLPWSGKKNQGEFAYVGEQEEKEQGQKIKVYCKNNAAFQPLIHPWCSYLVKNPFLKAFV